MCRYIENRNCPTRVIGLAEAAQRNMSALREVAARIELRLVKSANATQAERDAEQET